MRILVTGITGFVGGALVAPLRAAGHDPRGLVRDPARAPAEVPAFTGDALTGDGLDAALDGVDAAYYMIHSLEPVRDGSTLIERERRAAENFAAAVARAGVKRVIYLGGLIPADAPPERHLASRLDVERVLLSCAPQGIALRSSIVIGARSRSFRFLVRLVERLPLLPLPAWRTRRTQPIDQRDVIQALVNALEVAAPEPLSLDVAGLSVLSYGAMVERIADLMLITRPPLNLGFTATPLASRVAAVIAGERAELITPLMEGLEHDLLPRTPRSADESAALLSVRRHSFDSAVERALAEWEQLEPLRAR